jgi:hypothetical protein
MRSFLNWVNERPENYPGTFRVFSFMIFSSICITAAAFLPDNYWWLFGVLIVIDGLGTLARTDSVVSIDRAVLFLTVVLLTMIRNPFNLFFLTLQILALFTTLDFSLLLSKVDGTKVDANVLTSRLKSYAYIVLPAFLLSYLLLYADSQNLEFGGFEAVIGFGLASIGVLIVIYVVAHFLFSIRQERNARPKNYAAL